MVNPQLLDYVKLQLGQGNSQKGIKDALFAKGWAESDINSAFAILTPSSPPATQLKPENQILAKEPPTLVPRTPPTSQYSPAQPSAPKLTLTQASSTLETQEMTDQEKSPIVLTGGGKGWLFALLGTLILIAVSTGLFFYHLNNQKNALKDLINKQTDNFSRLETIYADVAKAFKESGGERKDSPSTDLLKAPSSPNVLGLEEDPTIIQLRKLGDLYKQGAKQTEEIVAFANQIEEKTQAIPLNLFLPKSEELFPQTKEFTDSNRLLFNYLEKENELGLKNYTAFFEIDVAFDNIWITGVTESSLKFLEEKLKSIDEMQKKYSALETSSLPSEIRQMHLKALEDFPKVKTAFQGFYEALRSGDRQMAAIALYNLYMLYLESVTGSEIARVEIISFWEGREKESVQEIKSQWEDFRKDVSSSNLLQSLAKFPFL